MSQSGLHIALLRGINVGGRNKLPMRELVKIFEEAGCNEVQTYIQSGNVLYRADKTVARGLAASVTDGIRKNLGLEIPVVTRTALQWRKVVAANPFLSEGFDPSTVAVGFLGSRPTPKAIASLDPDRSPPDSFRVSGSEIYLSMPNGVARSKLTNAYFDRTLGTVTTVRNWKTTLKLLELAGG